MRKGQTHRTAGIKWRGKLETQHACYIELNREAALLCRAEQSYFIQIHKETGLQYTTDMIYNTHRKSKSITNENVLLGVMSRETRSQL